MSVGNLMKKFSTYFLFRVSKMAVAGLSMWLRMVIFADILENTKNR